MATSNKENPEYVCLDLSAFTEEDVERLSYGKTRIFRRSVFGDRLDAVVEGYVMGMVDWAIDWEEHDCIRRYEDRIEVSHAVYPDD